MNLSSLEHLVVGSKKEILKKIFRQYLIEKVIPAYLKEENDLTRLVINQYFFPEEIKSDTVEVLSQIGRELDKKIKRASSKNFKSTPRDFHTKNLFNLLKKIRRNEYSKQETLSNSDKVIGKFSPRKQKE
jgi:hypothetical protein